jgi:cytochrome b561
MGVVLALHLGAVLWRAGVRRDTTLARMWPGYRPG